MSNFGSNKKIAIFIVDLVLKMYKLGDEVLVEFKTKKNSLEVYQNQLMKN